MRIRIDTPIAKLTADLTEEQVAEILGITLDYALGLDSSVSTKPKNPTPVVETVPAPAEPVPNRTNEVPALNPTKAEYKGFLYLQCEECKKFKGFMPKSPISDYHCDCGHTTHLKDMKALYVTCKCGSEFKYLTNSKDEYVTIDCLNCGAPVDLEYHSRNHNYTTIDG